MIGRSTPVMCGRESERMGLDQEKLEGMRVAASRSSPMVGGKCVRMHSRPLTPIMCLTHVPHTL